MHPGRAAEELKIRSSLIEAMTNSDHFELLIDVIQSVATSPLPTFKLEMDTVLGPTGTALEDTSLEILEAKKTLEVSYKEFNSLRQQVILLREN